MIPEFSCIDPVLRVPITFRGRVAVMQVARGRRERKADFAYAYGWQVVEPTHQDCLAVVRMVGGAWGHGLLAILTVLGLEPPGPASFVVGWVGVIRPEELALVDFVELFWGKVIVVLVAARVGGWIKLVHRLHHGRHKELSHEWRHLWAGLSQLIWKTV